MIENGYKMFRPTRAQRFWMVLGFALAPSCPVVEDRIGYVPGSMSTIATVRFSWGDRLRILLTGHIGIGSAIQTNVEVRAAFTTAKTVVLAPFS